MLAQDSARRELLNVAGISESQADIDDNVGDVQSEDDALRRRHGRVQGRSPWTAARPSTSRRSPATWAAYQVVRTDELLPLAVATNVAEFDAVNKAEASQHVEAVETALQELTAIEDADGEPAARRRGCGRVERHAA